MHSSKQSNFERDIEGKTSLVESVFEGKKHARKWFRRKKEACASSHFERSVASKHARAVISSAQWPRRKKKHARALISSAQTFAFSANPQLDVYGHMWISIIDFQISIATYGYQWIYRYILKIRFAARVGDGKLSNCWTAVENTAQPQCFRIMRSKSLLKRAP